MFLDDKDRRRQASKWIIGVVAACILIYLGVRHIHVIASAVSWLANLFLPMLIGLVMALILNGHHRAARAYTGQGNKLMAGKNRTLCAPGHRRKEQ